MIIVKYIATAVIGYLLGNISLGVLVAQAFGVRDIRKHGSGNSGSTNVLRTLGWLPGVMTLVGDCLKGLAACALGKWLCGIPGMLLGGVFAVIGHDYPVFFGFKGGKGIATSWAMIIAYNPWLGLGHLLLVVAVTAVTGYVSVGSIVCCFAFPISTAVMFRGQPYSPLYVLAAAVLGLLAVYRHRENIVRLARGEENKLDFVRIAKISERVMKRRQRRAEKKEAKRLNKDQSRKGE